MSYLRTLFIALLALTMACSEQKPIVKKHVSELTRQPVPDALGKRVPADAVALVRFDALDTLEPKLKTFMGTVDERAAEEANLDGLIAMAGVSRDQVDGSKPLAVAITVGDQGRPIPTVIVPLKDGTYQGGQAGDSVPALAKNLPGGDVAVRVDLERLIPQVRPMINEALDLRQLKHDPDLAANKMFFQVVEPMMAGVKAFLDSGETLEAAAHLDGGKVELNFAFTVLEGSALDTPPTPGAPLSELAKSFDAESRAMIMFLRADWTDAFDFFMPFYEQLMADAPQEAKDAFTAYVPKMKEVYRLMGTSFAMGVDFGGDGIRFDGVLKPEDPAAYVTKYGALLRDSAPFMTEMGMTFQPAPAVEIDGVKLDVFTMTMDMRKIMENSGMPVRDLEQMDEFMRRIMNTAFGREGMKFAQGVVGDRVLMSTAPFEQAIKTAKAESGKLPGPVAAALTDDTSFLFYMDMRQLMGGAAELFAKAMPENRAPKAPTGGPVHVWLRGSQTGRTYALGMHVDVGGIAAAGKSMDR